MSEHCQTPVDFMDTYIDNYSSILNGSRQKIEPDVSAG